MTDFGTRLRQLLDETKTTQVKLALFLGYSPALVTKWVKNQGEPSFAVIRKICTHFNCSADWLLGLSVSPSGIEFEHQGIRWIENIPDWLEDTQRNEVKEVIQIFRRFIIDNMQRRDLLSSITVPVRDSAATFQAAFRMGALRITHVPRNYELEVKLKNTFNIHHAIVADISELIDGTPPRVECITFLAATEAIKTLQNPSVVGLGSWHTMLRFAEQSLPRVSHFRATKWVPLMALPENNLHRLSANAIAVLMSQRHNGPEALQLPFLRETSPNEDVRRFQQVSEELKQATAVFFSVNGIGRAQTWEGEHLEFVEEFRAANYEAALTPLSEMYKYLRETNNHTDFGGELLGWMLDSNGNRYDVLADLQQEHSQSVDLSQIRDLASYGGVVWVIATRRYKANAVLAIIKSGLANAVVIDREIAKFLLALV